MKKLFLSSAGLRPEIKKYFLKLLEKDPAETKVAFIPTAADPKDDKSSIQRSINEIKEAGMEYFSIDLKKENQNSLFKKLSNCDVIWVNGGNAFYLLSWMRKSGFVEIINKILDSGIIYFGVSAGSYVAAPTIEAAGWGDDEGVDENIVNLKDLTGLNLVSFILTAHYNKEKYYQAMVKDVSSTKLPVVALYDTQAIIVEDNKWWIVGTGPKEFFNGFKEKL